MPARRFSFDFEFFWSQIAIAALLRMLEAYASLSGFHICSDFTMSTLPCPDCGAGC
jgi:hypothetical protein